MSRAPGNIPVAAQSFAALMNIGSPRVLGDKDRALVLLHYDETDPCIVFASPQVRSYRNVWAEASAAGYVDPASAWGDNVDIDHVFPKSWANAAQLKYVRLFPVWAEVNRSAGGGREKAALRDGIKPQVRNGIVFANEMQVMKILGHPVGTASSPERL